MTWQVFGADIPRFVAPEGRLLIEGQRTNSVRNPRGEGAGGTSGIPTNWNIPTTLTGLTITNLGQVVMEGVQCVRIRVEGTPTAGFMTMAFEASSAVVAAPSQTWTNSFFMRAVDMPVPPTSFRYNLTGRTAGGSGVSGNTFNTTVFVVDGVFRRFSRTETLTSDVTIERVSAGMQINWTAESPVDFTVDIGWPQLEQAAFASTPILPPVGAPAASTRGTDILTAPLSALGIADNGACTVLWRGVFNATNIGNSQTIAAIDDGTAANRCEIRLTSTGIPEVIRVTAGVVAQTNFGGAPPTLGATMRAGFTLDGAGRLAGVVAGYIGGAVAAVAGTATVGLSAFRHGTSVGNGRELWGETHTLTVLPRVLSDSDLQAAVAAL